MGHMRMRTAAAALGVLAALTTASVVAGRGPSGGVTADRPAVADGPKTSTPMVRSSNAAVEQFPEAAPSGTFTAITPYRAYDTRVNEPRKLFRGDDFNVDMRTDASNVPQIPSTATAIAYNLTVTETESTFGFVTLFNGDASTIPGTSSINWVLPGFTIANGGIVALGAPGSPYPGEVGISVDGAPAAGAHLIIDVTGYFTP